MLKPRATATRELVNLDGVRDGNKKGVFTRDRRPKAAAHALRARWTRLGDRKP